MIRNIVSCLLSLLIISHSARADHTQNFFVAEVSTELHRATVLSSATAYAIVNCNALIVAGELNTSGLDRDDFVNALKSVTDNRSHLVLYCRYQFPPAFETELTQKVTQHGKQLAETAGYQKVTAIWMSPSQEWKVDYASAEGFIQPDDASEPLIEDDFVRVYPIRTRLSKFLHQGADCVVEVVRPFDGRTTSISDELESSIRTQVTAAQVANKQILYFKLTSTSAGDQWVRSLFMSVSPPIPPNTTDPGTLEEYRQDLARHVASPAWALAHDLGFKHIRYQQSFTTGAPEELVGKIAPNFQLPGLNGEPMDLHEFIQERPALITFWGLACGPCRLEAPHLSALHEKYGKDFSIVAINAYGDDAASVTKYVQDESLKHPMVLDGKEVAKELYHVGAYPTTFWVNHHGEVIDYEIGFTSAERLERKVQELLKR